MKDFYLAWYMERPKNIKVMEHVLQATQRHEYRFARKATHLYISAADEALYEGCAEAYGLTIAVRPALTTRNFHVGIN